MLQMTFKWQQRQRFLRCDSDHQIPQCAMQLINGKHLQQRSNQSKTKQMH